MASNILVIVEYGAQKQRITLDTKKSYKTICDRIYSLFKLDSNKSKYILQKQDPHQSGVFFNVDEVSFINELKQYAEGNVKNSVIRLRLIPANSKTKPTNGLTNGNKTRSTSSQSQHDETDRLSCISAATIDIKQLIKHCLANLKETTDSLQMLDRYLHPEDYMDEECQPTDKLSAAMPQLASQTQTPVNSQIPQIITTSNSCINRSNIIDELIPALDQLMAKQQSVLSSSSSSSLLSFHRPTETIPMVLSKASSNSELQAPVPTTTLQPRSSNKSFSNRLGTTALSTNHESKSQKSASPISPIKQSVVLDNHEKHNQVHSKEMSPSPKVKCQVELQQFEPGTTVEGIVSVASNASYFFLQIIDENKDEFDQLSKNMHEYYSNLDKNAHYRPLIGDFCVAMYTEDARWYRARIIRYLSDQTCEVFYIDYGNMEELPINLLHELLPDFARIPARAIACTIAEILPPSGQEGWTKRATFAFASRCSNECVQAKVVDSTNMKWPMHFVELIVAKTQENIGTTLESSKLARHVSNREICEFWSNKIRLAQYILYNLQEPNPDRFPFLEQVPAKSEKDNDSTTVLSSSLKQTPTDTVEEKKNETVVPTAPSSLNPNAEPFTLPEKNEIGEVASTSMGDESDDEIESLDECSVISESSESVRMPIKDEIIVDTNLMPSTPLLKSWLPIEVTHIETPTRFYIRYIYGSNWNLGNGTTPELVDVTEVPEKNVLLKELTQEMTQCYTKQKRIHPGDSYSEGELVAVKFRSQWHRGRFIQYKSNIDFAHIFFIDYGYTRSVPIQMIRPIHNRFALHAEQAHLVHLYQCGQRCGRIEWSQSITDQFRELTLEGKSLYARIVDEPNSIELMSYDPLTKKWFSFYEHFVKHLHDDDSME